MPAPLRAADVPRIVPRAEWGAKPAKRRVAIRTPVPELYVHHLASEWHGAAGMRSAQRFHQDTRGWSDIAYTFLVDDDGTIYEGTGPDVVGSHTKGRNSRAMAICAMGDFDQRAPSPLMLASISWLIGHGREQGWWLGLTGGHRDAPGAQTACPGRFLYARIPQLKAAGHVAAVAPLHEESFLMTVARDDDDARRALVRQWFHLFLGRGPSSSDEMNLHVYVFATAGADRCLTGIVDSPEGQAFARGRRAAYAS